MRNFICISGKAQSGKDTLAALLRDELIARGYEVLIIHQADLLKFICKAFFNWNGEKDEAGRTLLQHVGTDIIRKIDPNFWVDFINKITCYFECVWDYIIIPDTRFPNEIERLKTINTNVFHIRINREGFTSALTKQQQEHPSETALDGVKSDFNIDNNKDIGGLRAAVAGVTNAIERRIRTKNK